MDKSTELLKDELMRFTGSEKFYMHSLGNFAIDLTEGIKHLCDNAASWWLIDLILSHQYKLYKEEFQVWKLEKQKGDSFLIIAEDGNKKRLTEQFIEYSDFPFHDFTVWLVNGTLMLPSEY